MVRGLDVFREHFAGLEFRSTEDLDIVLHIQALNTAFGEVFWKFLKERRYEVRQASNTAKTVFYCFQKPADERFPVMLELFCRAPDGIKLAEGQPPHADPAR